jgi:hypothetical protein
MNPRRRNRLRVQKKDMSRQRQLESVARADGTSMFHEGPLRVSKFLSQSSVQFARTEGDQKGAP